MKNTERERAQSSQEVMKRYPILVAHLICASLGYFTPKAAANAITAHIRGQSFYCEWYGHMTSGGKNILDVGRDNLSAANLKGANLSAANLRWADVRWTNLKETDLTDANLTGANLMDADLPGADLRGATLDGTILIKADLTGANVTGVNLRSAYLDDHTKLDGAIGLD